MKSRQEIALMRQEYVHDQLNKSDLDPNPFHQFEQWFNEAVAADLFLPNTVMLATSVNDQPSARLVLLKGFDESGFVFYTNYNSRKGRELAINPKAALTFYWEIFSRQVRIEGEVVRTSAAESEAYFRTRPYGSRIGAMASPQSEVIANREALQNSIDELSIKFPDPKDVPCPENWGGYRLKPGMIEFWQGRESRLHDRFRYLPDAIGGWKIDRLAP